MHSSQQTSSNCLRWSGKTDAGKVRANNEDAFLGLRFDSREVQHLGAIGEGTTESHDYVFAVSDGMGGARAGEYASRIAVEKITTLLPHSYHQAAEILDAAFAAVLAELFAEIHEALAYLGKSIEECHGMETTLSLCWFTPGRMYFGHIGDSRIYLLPAGGPGICQLSEDDTHVGWLLRSGKINQRAARHHPRRNVLQKALGGSNQFVTPQVGRIDYAPGDSILLCSDGLTEGLYDNDLEQMLRSAEASQPGVKLADRLVHESLARNGRDNSTALVIHVV